MKTNSRWNRGLTLTAWACGLIAILLIAGVARKPDQSVSQSGPSASVIAPAQPQSVAADSTSATPPTTARGNQNAPTPQPAIRGTAAGQPAASVVATIVAGNNANAAPPIAAIPGVAVKPRPVTGGNASAPFIPPTPKQIRDQPASVTAAQILSQRLNLSDLAVEKEVVRLLTLSYETRRKAAWERANQLGIPVSRKKQGGGSIDLEDFEEGRPVYTSTKNKQAAVSTNASAVREKSAYEFVDGEFMTVGVWDGAGIRVTHQDFSDGAGGSRVTIKDGSTGLAQHPTHVVGTIAGAGAVVSQSKGMAPAVSVDFYDKSNDLAELAAAGASRPDDGKLLLANGSYGLVGGWESGEAGGPAIWYGDFTNDDNPTNDVETRFGAYLSKAAALDGLAFNKPYFLMVRAAGNDRNDAPPLAGENWEHAATGTIYVYPATGGPQGDGTYAGGYDCITGDVAGKNLLTVGAVDDAVTVKNVSTTRDVSQATMSNFSSWGGTDDGRIKPDIVGNGVEVASASELDDTDVRTLDGTSQATPNVTGSAVLLQQYHTFLDPDQHPMRADMLKGLILHTADDLGTPGPDYQTGWGLMNTKAAADVIKAHFNNKNGAALYSGTNHVGQNKIYRLTWDGTKPLRATLCWTDPPALASTAHNDFSSSLVNDLNLRVTRPDGTTVDLPFAMPFALGTGGGAAAAVRAENHRDNVEQVLIPTPLPAGLYTIEVYRTGIGDDMDQNYALIISGNKAPPELAVQDDNGQNLNPGSSRVSFGYMPVGTARTRTFTIRNTAAITASLTGLVVSKDAADPADFTFTQPALTTLPAGGTTTFTVTFTSTQPGATSATLSIASNDPEDDPFTITVAAMAPVAGDVGPGWVKPPSDEVVFDSTGNVITSDGAKRAHADGALIWQWPGSPTLIGLIGVESDGRIVGFDSASGLFRLNASTGAPVAGPQGPLGVMTSVFGLRSRLDAVGNLFTAERSYPHGDTIHLAKKSYATGATLWQQDHAVGPGSNTTGGVDIAGPNGSASGDFVEIVYASTFTLDEDGATIVDAHSFFNGRAGGTGTQRWSVEFSNAHSSQNSPGSNTFNGELLLSELRMDANGDFLYAAIKIESLQSTSNVFVQKRSGATGGILWSVNTGNWNLAPAGGGVIAAALDAGGNLLLTCEGITEKRSGTNGALVWRSVLPFVSRLIACGGSNLVAVTGFIPSTVPSGFSYFTVSLSGVDGSLRWTRQYDQPSEGGYTPYRIAADALGNVAVGGGVLVVYPVGSGGGTITVACNQSSVATDEGQSVQNTGTFSSSAGNGGVTLSATKDGSPFGTITKNDANGTWTWTHTPAGGPEDGGTVTISASEGGTPVTTTFALTVNNVAPAFNAGANATVIPAQSVLFTRTINFTDPGADTWTATVNYGDGGGAQNMFVNQAAKSLDLAHPYFNIGTYTVTVTINDGDTGGSISHNFTVTVANQRLLSDWRLLHFGTTANTGDAADLANPTKDGIANLLKFAFNLDPHQSLPATALPQPSFGANLLAGESKAQGVSFVRSFGPGDSMTYSFTEPLGTTGIIYGAEYSTDLAAWLPVADTGTGGTHTFSVPIGSNKKLFMRLRITAP